MRFLSITFLFQIFLTSVVWAGELENHVLLNARDNYIIPAYRSLAESTLGLSERIVGLCRNPSAANLQNAQEAFHQTVDAWSAVEWFRVGPVMHNNRVERFLFFPDRKSRGMRQVQATLANQDKAVLDVAELQRKSVALQGLGALDYILFGKGVNSLLTGNAFRCQFADSIGKNLVHIATTLATDWQEDENLRKNWTIPNSSNHFFRTEKEAMKVIIGTLVHGLEAIRDSRISVFLREKPIRDRPKSAAYWRSGATMHSIVANLEGLEKLFSQSLFETILPYEAQFLGNSLRFEFKQSIKTAKNLDFRVEDMLSDPVKREKLEYLKLSLRFLIERLNTMIAPAAGLAAGFSFEDGD